MGDTLKVQRALNVRFVILILLVRLQIGAFPFTLGFPRDWPPHAL